MERSGVFGVREGSELLHFREDLKGAAMFLFVRSTRQKPRAGEAKNFRQEIYSLTMSSLRRAIFVKNGKKMKNFVQKLVEKIGLILAGILFMATWPILIVFAWIKSLFSEKISDSEKTEITKEVIAIFGMLLILSFLYYSTEKISHFLNPIFNSIGYWMSDHWYLFIILFILLAFLEHFKDKK